MITTAAAATPEIDPATLAGKLRPLLLHINRHLRRETQSLGVAPGQLSLLSAIADRPGIGVAELAAREGTAVPSVCAHVDKLEAAGLLTRTRDETTDRRRVGLRVTPSGRRMARAARSRRTAWIASRLASLSREQLAAVDAALEGLGALAEQR